MLIGFYLWMELANYLSIHKSIFTEAVFYLFRCAAFGQKDFVLCFHMGCIRCGFSAMDLQLQQCGWDFSKCKSHARNWKTVDLFCGFSPWISVGKSQSAINLCVWVLSFLSEILLWIQNRIHKYEFQMQFSFSVNKFCTHPQRQIRNQSKIHTIWSWFDAKYSLLRKIFSISAGKFAVKSPYQIVQILLWNCCCKFWNGIYKY